jgi:hypothetical protein
MADTIFEFVAEQLEGKTELEKLEARGTVRIALKEAGLDARGVTKEQMAVMLQRTMPPELTSRGIDHASQVCQVLVSALKDFTPVTGEHQGESPEDVFRRLGGR